MSTLNSASSANKPIKSQIQQQQEHRDPTALTLLHSLQSSINQGTHHGTHQGYQTSTAPEIYSTQIAHRSLILRGTSPDANSQTARDTRRKKRLAGQTRARARRRPQKLSAKEKRALGVYDLELAPGGRRTAAAWGVWKGLWRLWCGYVWEVLGIEGMVGKDGKAELNLSPVSLGPKIASLDLHGALLRVVKAGCPSLVGLWGVCVRETKFGVLLVDEKCCVRRVGKKGAVFRVEIPFPLAEGTQRKEASAEQENKDDRDGEELDLDVFLRGEGGRVFFEMSGNALLCRPVDRATKKFKARKYDGF